MENYYRFLIAEDLPTDAELAKREILKLIPSATFVVVETEKDFRRELVDHEPDLIISDFKMPEFDGLTALKITLEESPQTPVIIFTGSMNEDTAVECMKSGATDYVIKEHIKRLGPAVLNALEQKKIRAEKEKAQQELFKIQNRFANFAENATDLIYIFEILPEPKFVYVSPAATSIIGYSPEELLEDPNLAFRQLPPYDRHYLGKIFQDGDAFRKPITIHWIKKNGEKIWLEHKHTPIYNDLGILTAIEGIARNVTERIEAQDALKKTASLLALSQSIAKIGSWELDLINDRLTWSNEVYKIFGIPENEGPITYQKFLEMVHPDDRKAVATAYDDSVDNSHDSYEIEHRIIKRDSGEIRIVHKKCIHRKNESGKIVGSFGIVQDITEKKLVEEKLRRSVEQWTKTFHAIQEGIAIIDEDQRIIQCNQAFLDFVGKPKEEVLELNCFHHIHGSDQPIEECPYLCTRKSKKRETVEMKINGRDCEILIDPILDEQQNLRGAVHIISDVSEQKMSEEVIKLSRLRINYSLELHKMAGADEKQVFDFVIEAIVMSLQSRFAFIGFMDDKESTLTIQSWSKDVMEQCALDAKPVIFQISDSGIWGDCVRNRKPVIINNYADAHAGKRGTPLGHVPIDRFLAIPVFQDGKIVAVATVANKGSGYVESDIDVLRSLMNDTWKIIQQKRLERELVEQKTSLHTIIDHVPVMIAKFDQNGKILFGNNELIKTLGWSLEEWGSQNILEKCYPKPEDYQEVLNFMISKHPGWKEFKTLTKYGTILNTTWTNISLPDGSSLGIGQDITERKIWEEALVESETRFRMVVEEAVEIVFVTDTLGYFTYVNPAGIKSSGYSMDELSKFNFIDLIEPDYRARVKRHYIRQQIQKKEITTTEYPYRTKSGVIRWLNQNARLITQNDEFRGYYVIARDVTERHNAEEELIKSRQQLLDFFEDDITADFITTPGGKLQLCNETYLKLFGFDNKGEALKYPIGKLYKNERTREIFLQLVKKNKRVINHEMELRSTDGRPIHALINATGIFDKNNEMIQVRGYIFDITERKRAENELRKLSRVVEQSPASVIITNPAGEIEYVNEQFCRITGYTKNETIGKNPRILKSGNHNMEFYKELWNTILSGNDWFGEILNKKKNGDFYWESAHISSLRDSNGKLTHFVAIKEDITDQKKLYDDLVLAKNKAEQSDRLKSAFLANMSHEIRTPMNGILGFAELLKEPKLSGKEQLEYIRVIEQSGNRMLNIINDIINISKIEAGTVEVVLAETNINEQLRYVHIFFKPEIEQKGLQYHFNKSLPEKDAIIQTDSEKIYSILTNLVKNSIKFTTQGSIEIGCMKKNNFLEFFVKDTGVGIPSSQKDFIFERFRQGSESLNRNYEGAGLGLTISKAFAEMLGGKIWFDSEPGKGTSFYFNIPCSAAADKYNDHENNVNTFRSHDEANYDSKMLKILVAEDDDISAELLKVALKKMSKEFIVVDSGDLAIEACRDNPDLDLVLMDIKMPGMDGYKAVRRIREFNRKVVIIAQTAYGMSGDRENALEAGCNDYISKPIRQNDLIGLINNYFLL